MCTRLFEGAYAASCLRVCIDFSDALHVLPDLGERRRFLAVAFERGDDRLRCDTHHYIRKRGCVLWMYTETMWFVQASERFQRIKRKELPLQSDSSDNRVTPQHPLQQTSPVGLKLNLQRDSTENKWPT